MPKNYCDDNDLKACLVLYQEQLVMSAKKPATYLGRQFVIFLFFIDFYFFKVL